MKGISILNESNGKLHQAHYKYPNNPNILLALAANLASTGNIRDPIEIYNKILANDNRNIYALVGLAKLKFELNDITTTIELLKKATQIDPNMYELQMLYAQIHLTSGNIQEAKRMIEHILSQNPNDKLANLLKDRLSHLERGPFTDQKKTAVDLFIGETPITGFPISIEIEGFTVGSLNKGDNSNPTPTNPKTRLNLKLDNNVFRFANTSGILSSNALSLLETMISKNKEDLIWIANKYEEGGRQFYNFMYDIVSLVKTLDKLPVEFQKLMKIRKHAEILMHNRMVAELSYLYIENGHTVKLEQERGKSRPDLFIDSEYGDVKTIISPKTNDPQSYLDFANTLKDKREKGLKQVGNDGIIFVSPWSGIINSLFYTFFYEMKVNKVHDFDGWDVYTKIPPLQKGKTILVIATPRAFVDYYLVFDTQFVCDSIYLFATSRYKIIDQLDPMAYLKITNPLRMGFVVGELGSGGISFLTG